MCSHMQCYILMTGKKHTIHLLTLGTLKISVLLSPRAHDENYSTRWPARWKCIRAVLITCIIPVIQPKSDMEKSPQKAWKSSPCSGQSQTQVISLWEKKNNPLWWQNSWIKWYLFSVLASRGKAVHASSAISQNIRIQVPQTQCRKNSIFQE